MHLCGIQILDLCALFCCVHKVGFAQEEITKALGHLIELTLALLCILTK